MRSAVFSSLGDQKGRKRDMRTRLVIVRVVVVKVRSSIDSGSLHEINGDGHVTWD